MPKSKKPRKQRKRFYQAPLHQKHKFLSAHLSPSLRKKFNRRSLPVRKGDTVKVMRGDFKGLKGKVREVDTKKLKVFVKNITRRKVDGSETPVPFKPSNLMIVEPVMEDPKRRRIVERGKK